MRRIRILVNPSARSGRGPRALRALRRTQLPGCAIEWRDSASAADLMAQVRAAESDGIDVLGLAGGDGTVALALAALEGPRRVPLAILPIGSGNDFADHVGTPRSAAAAFAVLADGVPRRVDVARGPRRYCCVASVGLDEQALAIIHGSRWPRSRALNLYATLRALAGYRPRRVRLRWAGGGFDGPVFFAAVTNTRSYGGGFRVSPHAAVDDGLLDICIVGAGSRARLLANFPRILHGTHGALPDVVLAQSPWVRIEADDAPLPVSFDGELPVDATPVELRCEPAALQLLVPR